MIEVSLDKSGNNLWTLAAENGTVKIMNYLINMLYSWPIQDLDCVLHFQTCHREKACMDIVEQFGTNNLEEKLPSDELEKFTKHANNSHSDLPQVRASLQTLKKYLDTKIDSLDSAIRKRKTFWIPKHKRYLRRKLVVFRNALFFTDLEFHNNSLFGIISERYLSNCMIVQKIIELEIICHENSQTKHYTFNQLTSKNEDQNTGQCFNIFSLCNSKQGKEKNWNGFAAVCQNSNQALNEKNKKYQLIPGSKNRDNYLEPNGAFLSCMYNRVGKSPCTVNALDMAKETYPLTQEMPPLRCGKILAWLFFLLTFQPFWLCFGLFLFSFSLLTIDVYTDWKMVFELHQNYIQNKSYSCSRNTTEINQRTFRTIGSLIFGPVSAQIFENNMHAQYTATLLAVIIPFAGYIVLWLNQDNLGLRSCKIKVSLSFHAYILRLT